MSLLVFIYNIDAMESNVNKGVVSIGILMAFFISLPWVVVYFIMSSGAKLASKLIHKVVR